VPAPSIAPDLGIFRDRALALTTAGVFAIEWGLFVPITFLPTTALARGLDPALALRLVALLNAGSFVGRGLPGYFADRAGRFNAMIATVALCLLAVAALWVPAIRAGGAGVGCWVAFALVFGFASGGNISLTPVCVGQLCEVGTYGRYYATCYCVVSFGCLTGLPIAGALLRVAGVAGVVAFTGGCYVVGLACFWAARGVKVGWGLGPRF
jgi:MFS family permease